MSGNPMTDSRSDLREPVPPPAKVIAGCFASCAFAVAILTGLAVGNQTSEVLMRAIVCLFGGYVLGLIAGEVFSFAIREHLREYIAAHPIPNSDVSLDDLVGVLNVDRNTESKPNTPTNAANR